MPVKGSTFEPALMPDSEKEALCRSLLEEFGVSDIRANERGELQHACLVSSYHTDQDRNPTASLNYKKLTYHCLGCGASGGLLWFIATCRGGASSEARKWLAKATGTDGEVQNLSDLLRYFDSIYESKQTGRSPIPKYSDRILDPWQGIHPYLTDGVPELGIEGRGISEENLLHFRVGYSEHFPLGDKKTSERIVIPHFWKGDLVGWQTRRLDSRDGTAKYLASPDFPKDSTLFNYDPKRKKAGIVESMLSSIKHYHALPLEATFGASITERQVRLMERHETVVLWLDNDKAGWDALEGRYEDIKRGGKVVGRKLVQEGLGSLLGRSLNVLVVDNPYAADAGDMTTEDAVALYEAAIPYGAWERPEVLYCYRCKEVAHEGPCEEVTQMGLRKHGTGEILTDEDDLQKEAAKDWTDEDQAALDAENEK